MNKPTTPKKEKEKDDASPKAAQDEIEESKEASKEMKIESNE